MKAFHNDPKIKEEYLARVRAHKAADQIIHGKYWEDGKGCAVGCTIHGNDHDRYEKELGIPRHLAYLEDSIFEGLKNGQALNFPEQFLEAIPVGADLSKVYNKFMVWLLIDPVGGVLKYADERGIPAIKRVAELHQMEVDGAAAGDAARAAARAAAGDAARDAAGAAAWAAARAAAGDAAWAAAWAAARDAARAAAGDAARDAAGAAAWAAAWAAARAAARAAAGDAAWDAARAAAGDAARDAAGAAAWAAARAAAGDAARAAARDAAWDAAGDAAGDAARIAQHDKLLELLRDAK